MTTSPKDVLAFWFSADVEPRWFARHDGLDETIRARFGGTWEAAAEGALDAWAQMPEGWLALLIVLDQFSRNLHRHDARAWALDPAAQSLTLAGLARGDDQRLPPIQRVFAYLPLEHAEDMGMQHRSVQLFEQLAASVPAEWQAPFDNYLDYARRHLAVIERFGRFPHRNTVLGRPSTPDELAYLAQPGTGF